MAQLKTMEKDFENNGETVTIRFTKLSCTAASSWLMRGMGILARAGIKGSISKGALSFQMPNLQDGEAQDLLDQLVMHCEIMKTDPVTGKTLPFKMSASNINDSGITLPCLMDIRKEALDYNFGFFSGEENSISGWIKQKFALLNIEMFNPLSES